MEQQLPNIPPPEVGSPVDTHLWYVRRDIAEIKTTLKELSGQFVTVADYNEHLKIDQDHEERIRIVEKITNDTRTQIRTWGSLLAILLGALQIIEIFFSIKSYHG